MQYWLLDVFGTEFVDAEAPIDVHPADNALNEPQPDVIVLNRECGDFVTRNPLPSDICLLIEVCDGTLNYDLKIKSLCQSWYCRILGFGHCGWQVGGTS